MSLSQLYNKQTYMMILLLSVNDGWWRKKLRHQTFYIYNIQL